MNTYHPSALPPATKLFLDALQAGGKLKSPMGPTVLAQAGAQLGVNPQQGMEPPPEEQQGIAAILNQAQQAGPTIANNQAVQQQQQLVDKAANKAAPAAVQMLQGQQKPQGLATGGLAALPAHIQEFKEGGVIGYAGPVGSYVDPYVDPYSLYLSSLRPSQDSSSNMAERPAPEEATSEIGDFFRGITELAGRSSKLRQQRDEATPSIFTALTPTERAQKAATLQGIESQIATLHDPAEAAARAMTAPTSPSKVSAKTTAPSIGVATPAPEKTGTKAAAPAATSSTVSVSTREKMGGPTASEQSGIAAGTPTAQNFDDKEAQRLYKLRQTQIENKPDFQSMGLADIAAMQKRNEDSSSFRRYAAIAGARRPGINAGASMMAAAGQFAETQDALANAADAAKTSLAKATYSESIGDTDAMLKHQEDFNKHKEEMIKLDAQIKLGIYQQQQMNKRNEEVNAVRAQIAELRAMSGLSGKTGNLKDQAYVYDKVSDNVTKQMENLKNFPSMALKIKTPADLAVIRENLYAVEVQKMIDQNANVPASLMKYVQGKTATPATGKLDFANIGT